MSLSIKGHSAAASCRKGQLVNDVEQVTAKLHLEEAGQKAVGWQGLAVPVGLVKCLG